MRTALLISTEDRPEYGAEAAAGVRPMPDYLALARALDADILDRRRAIEGLTPTAYALARRAGPDAPQAALAMRLRRQYDRFLCDSEGIALPLATLLRATGSAHPLFFVAHRLTTRAKRLLWRAGHLPSRAGGVFLYADAQAACAGRLGLAPERLHRIPFHADHRFFHAPTAKPEMLVVSVGQERRDYATLVAAAERFDYPVHILARSPWSRTRSAVEARALPSNVRFLPRHSHTELRDLYARAAVVAVPVQDVDFQAGITSLLEAMAMGKPVVATGNPGLREVFADREAGLWVPPGDADSMAWALAWVLAHPREAIEMGRRGRALVEGGMTLDHWVSRISTAVRGKTDARATG